MHNIKLIREQHNSYKKKFSDRNLNINLDDLLNLDKKNRELIKKKEKLEQEIKAISKKTGARGLRSIIEALLLKTMFKLPTMENVKEVVIDQSVVKNKTEPLIIYSKNKKISAA